jgi:hypothetical protein
MVYRRVCVCVCVCVCVWKLLYVQSRACISSVWVFTKRESLVQSTVG